MGARTAAGEEPARRASERVAVETRLFPYSKLKDPFNGTPQENLEIQPENFRVRLGLPPVFVRAKKAIFTPSLTYEQIKFNYRHWDSVSDPYRIDTLQSIGANIFYRQPLRSPLWGFGWFVSAALASDFHVVTLKSLRLQGGAFWTRKVTGGNVSLGLAVLDNFGRPRLFPAVGFEPSPESHHKFTLRVPVEASYLYSPGTRWEAGVAARVAGMNAELTESGIYKGKRVAYSAGTVGPTLRFKLTRTLGLSLDGGWVPYHRFQIVERKDKFRDYDMRTPYFVAANLKLSM